MGSALQLGFVLMLLWKQSRTAGVRRLGCLVHASNEKLDKESVDQMFESRAQTDKRVDPADQRGPFKTLVGDSSQMTVQKCVHHCWVERYTYAALQDGSRCYCANSRKGLVFADNDWSCTKYCTGNFRQLCGGRMALSVYKTGYESEPTLHSVDLSKGLLGCYEEATWRDWCGAPNVDRTFDNEHLNHDQEVVLESAPANEVMATHKPPLVSMRMSALLCATFCVSGPVSSPVAVVKKNNTCCCGGSVDKVSVREQLKVDFNQFCTLPCADFTSKPHCVGFQNGRHYVSVYQTLSIWEESDRPFVLMNLNGSWLRPEFPENDNFEAAALEAKWPLPERDELGDADLIQLSTEKSVALPIVDPANMHPFVVVVDAPEDDTRVWGIMSSIFISCLLFSVAIYFFMKYRQNQRRPNTNRNNLNHHWQEENNNNAVKLQTQGMASKSTLGSDSGDSSNAMTLVDVSAP